MGPYLLLQKKDRFTFFTSTHASQNISINSDITKFELYLAATLRATVTIKVQ
jgi:hypothetical protein